MIKPLYILVIVFLILSCISDTVEIYSTVKSPATTKPILISKKMTEKSLTQYRFTADSLRILRNEIYARKGYTFTSKELQEYFLKFEWYKPINDNKTVESLLTETDLSNIKLIKQIEENTRKKEEADLLVKQNFNDFSFKDYLACIDEINLPYGGLKDQEPIINITKVQTSKSNSYCDERLLAKYNPDGYGIAGKIKINDTLYAVGYYVPADVVFKHFYVMSISGKQYNEFYIPSETSPLDDLPSEERFSSSLIDKDFILTTERWTEKYTLDSNDNPLDTTIIKDDFEHISIRYNQNFNPYP